MTNTESNLCISNGVLSAEISTLGAELQSLRDDNSGEEYLWQGDAEVWSGRAPVLFPLVGALRNDSFEHQGQRYTLAKHGFARRSRFEVLTQSAQEVVLVLRDSAETRQQFPWQFELQVGFALQQQRLTISYALRNASSDALYFNLGSHPALRLPLDNCALEDYSISFDQTETCDCWQLQNNLLHQRLPAYLDKQRELGLSATLFDQDALIFRDIASRHIGIEHREQGRRLCVDTGGAPHLGLWSKPGAAFVCIEPWWGYNDFTEGSADIAAKPGIQQLPPGAVFDTFIALDIG